MNRIVTLTILLLTLFTAQAQDTWSSNIAQIVYDNCSSCHNPQGIAPFSLLTYTDALAGAGGIKSSVASRQMPPWIADKNYKTYAHQRVLTDAEITAITDWVDNGSQEGDASKTPPPPVYSTKGFIPQRPDLELKLPVYTSKATSTNDDYVCFSMPSNLTSDKRIRGFEVIPGNHTIVHHALVYLDATGTYKTDTSGGVCTGPTQGLIGGYVPGSPPTVFPTNGSDFNLGFEIKAGSNVVLAMHYPEGSFGKVDSTIIRFWFYDDNVSIRKLTTRSIIENWDFNLPANQITEVSNSANIGVTDYSVLSVFPHMHLLGSSIKSYALTPTKDTLRFVDIPHWDFEWQEFLFFEKPIKVPAGSTLFGSGIYDNTSNNVHNPNNPPKMVFPGLNTSDEMFLIYFHYLPYVSGDEHRDIDKLTTLSTRSLGYTSLNIGVYPNPASSVVHFNLPDEKASSAHIRIYDVNGLMVGEVINHSLVKRSNHSMEWQIPETVASGLYFYSINMDGKYGTGSFLVD